MKNILSILLLFPILTYCQSEKGLSPIQSQAENLISSTTYAVVVGISNYQDEAIPDLQFADEDAKAFAGFLQSPAGGSLDENHLKVLINEQATHAQFAMYLDWLWEVVAEGDKVILYFSGHGDVEKKSLTQPGYLLCWDAPSRVYMAGGAMNVRDLNDVIATLSIQNKAKVILITDACRAGKLSGSSIGGAQATASHLAKQYSNEVKILSCQPDEYSIEGRQWGDGRGVFSYHLLDGLYGMADMNGDQEVSLKEISRYLQDHVSEEVAPQHQNPMTIGSVTEKLTDVYPGLLTKITQERKKMMPIFAAIDSRGMEEGIMATADSSVVEAYFSFKKTMEAKQFLFPKNNCTDFYFEKLIADPGLKQMHSTLRRNYAAALQDDAQQVMNEWVRSGIELILGDDNKGRISKKVFSEKVKVFPACLDRAAELLGNKHYLYPTLKARKHFFEGYILANSDQNPNIELGMSALSQFRKALQLQPELPQAYWQMSNVFGLNLIQSDSAIVYAQKAVEYCPSWTMPYTSLAFLLSEKFHLMNRALYFLDQAEWIDSSSASIYNVRGNYHRLKKEYNQAEKYLLKAIQLDSTFAYPYNNLGIVYKNLNQLEKSEKYYKKAILLDSSYVKAYNNLGNLYRDTRRSQEAAYNYQKAIGLDSTYANGYANLGYLYQTIDQWHEAEKFSKKAISLDSTSIYPFEDLGNLYIKLGKYSEAEKFILKAYQLDSTNKYYAHLLAYCYSKSEQWDEAESYYYKVIQMDSLDIAATTGLGLILMKKKSFQDAENLFKKVLILSPGHPESTYNMSCIYSLQKQNKSALEWLEKTLEMNKFNFNQIEKDSDLENIRPLDEYKALLKKYFPENVKD